MLNNNTQEHTVNSKPQRLTELSMWTMTHSRADVVTLMGVDNTLGKGWDLG